MSNLTDYIGNRIRLYRKQKKLSIEELAKNISKSKSTVSKYESGSIVIDIETLFDIANVLGIKINQLVDYEQPKENAVDDIRGFFSNNHFYVYFYDGRKNKINRCYMKINDFTYESKRDATLYTGIESFNNYINCETLYYGKIEIHDIVTNLTFVNQANDIERINFIAINPINNASNVSALMTGISGNPFIPVSIKCIISLKSIKEDNELINDLIINKEDVRLMKKYNFFTNQRIL
ncbi:helix-turn-helix domain-containing protein [Sedimentibacter sp. zth1]|uniref:helix-turn-helix domain-containing protein n=1 Tax=Sedimentibacter sp. zth1 TaxID=2816908 RepID=UPI001A926572|nr:helix-turn-helix domain-containing protein [Sedimentibacter sp. zth1]QSX06770.1 helix-turn-helix domain-containing protein [Sedimentibacter sp. zth1]